jgi:hypothetical protein
LPGHIIRAGMLATKARQIGLTPTMPFSMIRVSKGHCRSTLLGLGFGKAVCPSAC